MHHAVHLAVERARDECPMNAPRAQGVGAATPATPLVGEIRVIIEADHHIALARHRGRALAHSLGFSSGDATIIATAISELARNVLLYAMRGEIAVRVIEDGFRSGIAITAHDDGPGIEDIERALEDGYSTSGRLGVGLPGVRRLMDEFSISSGARRGTTVTVAKWKSKGGASVAPPLLSRVAAAPQ